MTGGIGTFLKELRTSRQMSLNRLAERAQLSKRTLSYWEAGTYQPCLPELEALLTALDATQEQREQAFALVNAPRATRRLRADSRALWLEAELGPMPSGGDLLRAMRYRFHLYLEEVAEDLHVSAGTVSRWEQGKVVPSVENLAALLSLLRAHPQEQAALRDGFPFLRSPLKARATFCEALRVHFLAFLLQAYARRSDPLHDLCFLTLAATAWPMAARGKAGRELLADIYAHYAAYLADLHRFGEARLYAQRALDFLEDKSTPESYYVRAAIVCAQAQVFCGPKPTLERGLELLRLWLPATPQIDFQSWILEDMAIYLSLVGELGAALELSRQACQIVEDKVDPIELRLRQLGLARLQLQAGLAEQALTLVRLHLDDTPFRRADVELVWAEGLLALGEKNAAQDWLQRAYKDITTYDLAHLRSRADALAQRL
jgi:transcriptional regulator with XRE-family HTH domain